MIEQFTVRTFKTLDDVTVELGMVNVFIGANGSGKSNLLEALGILSAAADGKVDDQSLLARGVRPGLPALYKTAIPARPQKEIPRHLFFGARNGRVSYEVTLHNPLQEPAPAWRFKTEHWKDENNRSLVTRVPADRSDRNPERGMAALEAVRLTKGPALELLTLLQNYVIFSPATAVLRGTASETQPRQPVGLSGGDLPRAIDDLYRQAHTDKRSRQITRHVLQLIDWAKSIEWARADQLPLSPSAATSKDVIQFRDRFMHKDGNVLSGYDASEGALYALFLAVIAGHRNSPALCAVDNADHGLNPRLARSLFERLCQWYLNADKPRQILLTTHNPLVLDGLPLQDDRVRLFTVSRTDSGRTSVRRVVVDDRMSEKAEQGWSLSRLWVMGHLGGVPGDDWECRHSPEGRLAT
ncbi:MAG: AAA family ATPase [Proteobacteria bacterium]|nr:AAA family ATPase [Pseudomonadota bacterium]